MISYFVHDFQVISDGRHLFNDFYFTRRLHKEMSESKKALALKDSEHRELEELHQAQLSAAHSVRL